MRAEIALDFVVAVLVISYGNAARNCTGCEDINASLPAGFTGQITCPSNYTVNITRIMCSTAPCTVYENMIKPCPLSTIDTIRTSCNGNTTCTVSGMDGSCLDSKDIVHVKWSCDLAESMDQ